MCELNNALSRVALLIRFHAEYMRQDSANRETHAVCRTLLRFTEYVTHSRRQKFNNAGAFRITDQPACLHFSALAV